MTTRKKDWVRIAFFVLSPVIGILGTAAYALAFGVSWWQPVAVSDSLCGDRGIGHRGVITASSRIGSYECHPAGPGVLSLLRRDGDSEQHLHLGRGPPAAPPLRRRRRSGSVLCPGGACGFPTSAGCCDATKAADADFKYVKDLERDPIVMFQHRHYVPIVLATNFGFPLLVGFATGDIWGALLLAGVLRLVVNHHVTFFINSLAHGWGRQPYTDQNTSRDNPILALLTYGEGYHNFHHLFANDYRNGIRWWHWDPTKWLIRALAAAGPGVAAAPHAAARHRALAPADGGRSRREPAGRRPVASARRDPAPAGCGARLARACRRPLAGASGEAPAGLEGVPQPPRRCAPPLARGPASDGADPGRGGLRPSTLYRRAFRDESDGGEARFLYGLDHPLDLGVGKPTVGAQDDLATGIAGADRPEQRLERRPRKAGRGRCRARSSADRRTRA